MNTIPEGYMQDTTGRLVPVSNIKQSDLERDEIVKNIVVKAQYMTQQLKEFKDYAKDGIDRFVKRSAREYKTHLGGRKGNLSLLSFDGQYKVTRAINEHLIFDEKLQIAKALIDECIQEWTDGSRDEIKVLINDAFSVNKQGKIDKNRILGLRRLKIKNSKWKKAMNAISESLQVAGSKEYVRVYEKQEDGSYKQISLDIAAL